MVPAGLLLLLREICVLGLHVAGPSQHLGRWGGAGPGSHAAQKVSPPLSSSEEPWAAGLCPVP